MGLLQSTGRALGGVTGAGGMAGSMERPSAARMRSWGHLTTEFEDDGRRWAPRSVLLLGGGFSLVIWGALIVAIIH
jgi:hypothetical protein